MRNPFGWSYPAGAENDPRAPWNEKPDKCPECEEYFDDDGLECTAVDNEGDGECFCPRCWSRQANSHQGTCVCDRADVDDHPPYDEDGEDQ